MLDGVYFDLDGVLRDFELGIFGEPQEKFGDTVNGVKIFDHVCSNLDLLRKCPPTAYLPIVLKFFARKSIPIRILSHQPKPWRGATDHWIVEHLQGLVVEVTYVNSVKEKLQYLQKNVLLIDDHPELVGLDKVVTLDRLFNRHRETKLRIDSVEQLRIFLELAYGSFLTVGEVSELVHKTARLKGWYDSLKDGEKRNCGELIALIHSELSECLEALRQKEVDHDNAVEELADAVIRIFDFAEHSGYDICTAIKKKMVTNLFRPYKHGKVF